MILRAFMGYFQDNFVCDILALVTLNRNLFYLGIASHLFSPWASCSSRTWKMADIEWSDVLQVKPSFSVGLLVDPRIE
jgi:hypothetical protein